MAVVVCCGAFRKRSARFTLDGRRASPRPRDPGHRDGASSCVSAGTVAARVLWLVQWRTGAAKISPVRSRSRLGLGRARLDADPGGSLAFLAGHRALLPISAGDFRMFSAAPLTLPR